MKKPLIGLVDYDMGNLRSVTKAMEFLGARTRWVESPGQLAGLNALVLPGVGAYARAMQNLRKQKLVGALQDWIIAGRLFLGICLGYQLLFTESEESQIPNETVRGLGIVPGKVVRFQRKKNLRVPHMGWNTVRFKKTAEERSGFEKKLFAGIKDNDYFYFVHSYYPENRAAHEVATLTNYHLDFASSIVRANLFASQFHPEKSSAGGMRLLKNFVSII